MDEKMNLTIRFKGGPGSGHRGHAGRPGKQGGSVPGEGGGAAGATPTSVAATSVAAPVNVKRPTLRNALKDWYRIDMGVDKVIVGRDKSSGKTIITGRKGFYYRFNFDERKTASAMQKALPSGSVRQISAEERYRDWPKDSYWEVKFEVLDEDAIRDSAWERAKKYYGAHPEDYHG